ncbi:MAG: protein-glutamate O-methyltransferase CheR [Bacillota bacterium]|nr:protein-glutamate O-methyltransferase CheR [Bacillota bacterium]
MDLLDQEFERFIQKIYKKTGLDLSQYKRKQMERRIRSLMKSHNINELDEYFLLLDKSKAHFDKFMDHLTINVSEFFRNPVQWAYLKNTIIPKISVGKDSLKVWSAGCSTGEEPYSLAMMLNEVWKNKKFAIHATDLDREVLRKANLGIYNEKALVNVEKSLLNKYFTNVESVFTVKDELKKNIKFMQQNLLKDSFEKGFDVILCRNVVIYFTEETKFVLYQKFFEALRPGGVFFTGNTEQIFRAKEIGFTSIAPFFYQKPM